MIPKLSTTYESDLAVVRGSWLRLRGGGDRVEVAEALTAPKFQYGPMRKKPVVRFAFTAEEGWILFDDCR
jgi:hypothetical protein